MGKKKKLLMFKNKLQFAYLFINHPYSIYLITISNKLLFKHVFLLKY